MANFTQHRGYIKVGMWSRESYPVPISFVSVFFPDRSCEQGSHSSRSELLEAVPNNDSNLMISSDIFTCTGSTSMLGMSVVNFAAVDTVTPH